MKGLLGRGWVGWPEIQEESISLGPQSWDCDCLPPQRSPSLPAAQGKGGGTAEGATVCAGLKLA